MIGEVGSVRDALVQIVLRLRDDVLKDRDSGGHNQSSGNDSMYAGGSGLPVPPVLPSVPPSLGYEHSHRGEPGSSMGMGMGMLPSGYGYGSLPMSDNGYGSLSSSYPSKFYGGCVLFFLSHNIFCTFDLFAPVILIYVCDVKQIASS